MKLEVIICLALLFGHFAVFDNVTQDCKYKFGKSYEPTFIFGFFVCIDNESTLKWRFIDQKSKQTITREIITNS